MPKQSEDLSNAEVVTLVAGATIFGIAQYFWNQHLISFAFMIVYFLLIEWLLKPIPKEKQR